MGLSYQGGYERLVAVRIPLSEAATLDADVEVPHPAHGLVVFAHGSGSSRHSPRNQSVARSLNDAGLATVLTDLLTAEEEQRDEVTREHRFDLDLLADRLARVLAWASGEARLAGLRAGLFGASTGGGAALIAAARAPERVASVVSRGGRPDLAGAALPAVRCPVLLLVGERDQPVLELNEQAARALSCPVRLVVVPGATHLFGEPGALERVAQEAAAFFLETLSD
jgi:putative phosphoribosyl transferase